MHGMRRSAFLILVVALTACGGGGSSLTDGGTDPLSPDGGQPTRPDGGREFEVDAGPIEMDAGPPPECSSGETRSCGTDEGICESGLEQCREDGTWGLCTGSTGPATTETDESVDGLCDGEDSDCDGAIDEGCSCVDGEIRNCGSDVGVCESGSQACGADGVFTECDDVRPTIPDAFADNEVDASLCNGLDDDCDGETDEGCACTEGDARNCGSSVGVCELGTQTCGVDGMYGACEGSTEPTILDDGDDNEVASALCNGLDDDCDGETDEGCSCIEGQTQPCGSDEGICVRGIETCGIDGMWGACTDAVSPAIPDDALNNEDDASLCNEEDDDCDGNIDEGCGCVPPETRDCGSDIGVCMFGSQACQADGTWGACTGATEPTVLPSAPSNEDDASLCNGLDDDCDSNIDEGCECSAGETQDCGSDVGVCVEGMRTCDLSGNWGACSDTGPSHTGPQSEAEAGLCNGLDDDCNGVEDDGCACVGGAVRGCGTDAGVCVAGTQSCTVFGTWGACSDTGPTHSGPGTEAAAGLCNGLDDDCNGVDDDGCGCVDGETEACGTDEGVCVAGTRTCDAFGVFGACNDTGPTFMGADESGSTYCNNLDDNCDGEVDEGCACHDGETQPCGATGEGVCQLGTQTCDAAGEWGACLGEVTAVERMCGDGLDYDCDGTADDLQAPCAPCTNTRVTTDARNDQRLDVIWNGTHYGVAYESDHQIYFLRMDAAGTLVGTPMAISTVAFSAHAPALAWSGTEFAVTWHDSRGMSEQVYFARISASTGAKLGPELLVSNTDYDATNPDIVFGGGAYGLVWEDFRDGHSAIPFPLSQVYFQRVSAAGALLGSAVPVTTDAADSREAKMAFNDTDDEFAVVWADARYHGGDTEVMMARLSTAGAVLAETRITNFFGNSHLPDVAWGNGVYGVSWRDRRLGFPDGRVYFSRVSAAGAALDSVMGEGEGYAVSTGDETNFLGGMATSGDEYIMVWNALRTAYDEVVYSVTDASGMVAGPIQITNGTGPAPATGYERVAYNGTDFGVVWYDGRHGGNEIFFGRVSPNTGFCE